jgi:hypothetical protein
VQIRRAPTGAHTYRIYLTKEELLNIANDSSIADWRYVEQLRRLIDREAKKINGS